MQVKTKLGTRDYRTVWMDGTAVAMIDQTLLPDHFVIVQSPTSQETYQCIKDMTIRGAGAIGVAAAYATLQAILECKERTRSDHGFKAALQEKVDFLKTARPTAYNLFHAIDRVAAKAFEDPELGIDEAHKYAEAELMACKNIGLHGSELIEDGMRIMTHCNAGWLAFVDHGSALAPIYEAKREGKKVSVWVSETRPWNQGRLTAWELENEGIEHTLIADNAAGLLIKQGLVDLVITGADRIAVNYDTANKVGTYMKALAAKEHGIPFYVAAPLSTFDPNCKTGGQITIEERNPEEVKYVKGKDEEGVERKVRIHPASSKAFNPGFDVTPAKLISKIITNAGVIGVSR